MLWGCEETGSLHSLLMRMKNGADTVENDFQFLTRFDILLPYDPDIVLFGIYTNELENYTHIQTCTWMFRAALFITTKYQMSFSRWKGKQTGVNPY